MRQQTVPSTDRQEGQGSHADQVGFPSKLRNLDFSGMLIGNFLLSPVVMIRKYYDDYRKVVHSKEKCVVFIYNSILTEFGNSYLNKYKKLIIANNSQ